MGTLTDLLALFPEGVDQVPHGAVAKALLSVPSRAYFHDTRAWLDAQVAAMVRLKWVEPASGPRGGKAWRLTADGQTARADALRVAVRREAARRRKEAGRRAAEARGIEMAWTELATGTSGLRIEGETVVVELRSGEPWELERLARSLDRAADLLRKGVQLRPQACTDARNP